MPKGNEKFIRRQRELSRQKWQEEKRAEKLQRKQKGGSAADDEIAAIQAALDAGLQPGNAADRGAVVDEGEAGDASPEQPE